MRLLTWQLLRPYGRLVYYALFPARRPRYFLDAWRYPAASASSCPGPQQAPAFLFFPMNDWHVRMQRTQHLAAALARSGHLCVYVNPHLGLEATLPYAFDRVSRVLQLAPNLLELHVHLPREHELSTRALLASEVARIVRAVNRTLVDFKAGSAALVASSPAWNGVLEQLRAEHGSPVIYDCHDLLSGFGDISPEIVNAEGRLIQLSDRIVFSAANLLDTMVARHPAATSKAALIRNAVTPADFHMPAVELPERRIAGYVGALDTWFDCEAMREAAARHPSVDFVLLGAVRDPRIWQLRDCANVRFEGEVPYSDLGRRMAAWSVAVIPFLRNPLTLATSPIKIYEYFSAGLPVVATRLPELELFPDLVYLSSSPREFAEGVSRALAESDPALPDRRRAVAAQETWTERANALLALAGPQHRTAD